MKNQIAKEGLIEARVNKFADISQKIKEFINQKSSNSYTPFYREEEELENRRGEPKAKRSLTDWRQLYHKNNNKIKPKNAIYPATADHFRPRCSMTGQCQRTRKAYTASKANTLLGERNFMTRQSKRARNLDSKRQSLIGFALAQNNYENEILKDEKNLTAKERKFYEKKRLNPNKLDITRVGQYLSNISQFREEQLKGINATEKYINAIKDFEYVRMMPYNLAKIKEKYKIDNTRYLQSRGRSSDYGLRFYERA